MHTQAMQQCQHFLGQSSGTKRPFLHEIIGLHLIWFKLCCSSTQPSLLTYLFFFICAIQPKIISKCCYWAAAMDYRPHFKHFNCLQCVSEGEKMLSMTCGFFITTFMLIDDLICRSLEVCANYSWKETWQLIHRRNWPSHQQFYLVVLNAM